MNFRDLIQPGTDWLDEPSAGRVFRVAATAAAGLAIYGFTVGYWRSPVMAFYVAAKMPLLVALTLGCNGLLNGLLGLLLGTGLGFRQSLLALLSAFAVAALILGSLAPVTFLLAWNAPPPDSPGATGAHAGYLVFHTLWIGFAGITANVHLHRLLASRAPGPMAANATLFAWLAGNGFLGAQFSWVLRPFFGNPNLEVAFLRPNPMRGNFYQVVWRSLDHITGGQAWIALLVILMSVTLLISRAMRPTSKHQPTP